MVEEFRTNIGDKSIRIVINVGASSQNRDNSREPQASAMTRNLEMPTN
jgi:hypothetical protein